MPKWIRVWSVLTAAATVALLVLGALVTSFRVGMADPIWPTEPWRLALIDWSEPNAGFLIEHTHRLAGFTIGAMMAVLALGIWHTESNRSLRWCGLGSLTSLLGAFGYLHGVLIRQTKDLSPGAPLVVPPSVAASVVIALGAVLAISLCTILTRNSGWGIRLVAVSLLIGVMIQGLFGGLRVYLNALFGPQFAVIHGAFAQVVFGLAIAVMCLSNGRQINFRAINWLAVFVVLLQVVFGVLLRQLSTPFGARLHLATAILAAVVVVFAVRASWINSENRTTAAVAMTLIIVQIFLGVESWMIRFANGLNAAEHAPILAAEAWIRTVHAVVGYLLFGSTVMLSFRARSEVSVNEFNRTQVLEGVA
jgi:heme a synthase